MISLSETPKTFSVVVCAYTKARWGSLLKAVGSIQNQSLQPSEIILVIDYNPELYCLAQESIRDVTVVENGQTRGLAGARNTGISVAQSELIAFMDEDAIAAPDWLYWLSRGYWNDQVLGVGGTIIPKWTESRPMWFPTEFDWVVGCTYRGMPETPSEVRNVIGCNMSFQRSVLQTVGGFRLGRVGLLSIGRENDETEICLRVREAYRSSIILFQPASSVEHEVSPERSRLAYFVLRCFSEGVSKATVTRLFGSDRALQTERNYVLKILLQGFVDYLMNTLRGDLSAFLRAIAIVFGLGTTGIGYAIGLLLNLVSFCPVSERPRR